MPRSEAVARYRHSPKGRKVDAALQRRKRAERRSRVISAYGGSCACCGEDHPDFLVIDHVFNDGYKEKGRWRTRSANKLYTKLEKLGYPRDRYQLLCWNCNSAKSFRGGCPHKRRIRANIFE